MNRCLPNACVPVTVKPSSSAAPSANRPCGLSTEHAFPAKARFRAFAWLWTT
jgi:hypothetical protein